MKRTRLLLVLGILFATSISSPAEEPPYRAFVAGLRERHLSDLALDYLKELSQKKLSPEMAAVLPLEMARTRLALAEDLSDPGQRADLYAKAQDEFNAFLKGNPKPEVAVQVQLDLAHLLHLQAKMQLAQALQLDSPDEQVKQKREVRNQFDAAAAALQQVVTQTGQLLAKYQSPKTPAEQTIQRDLTQAALQAQFEQGLTFFEELPTFDEQTEGAAKRYQAAQKAMDILTKVAAADDKNPLAWKARAWLGRCYQETDTPRKAKEEYTRIIEEPGAYAEAGKRLARYFQLLLLEKDPTAKGDPLVRVQRAAEDWLATYPADQNTPEGFGVRFLLADAYHREALRAPKAQQSQPKIQDLYARAEKLYDALEHTSNDFSLRARERKLSIILARTAGMTENDVSKLNDFQECYVRAQLEIAKMSEADKKYAKEGQPDAAKYEEARKQYLKNVVNALQRGLDLANDKTPAADRGEARFILAYAYFAAGQPYEAAVAADDFARTDPKATRAPTAAGYALEAYSQIVSQDEAKGASAKSIDADRARLRNLAAYMEQTWPNDPATDLARHQLGALALRDKNYPEAIALLSRIKPTYSGYSYAEYQLATAAMQADRDNVKPMAGQPPYKDLALAALQKVPDLTPKADPATAQVYFYAKLELANLLFKNKQYKEMQDLTEQIRKRFEGAQLEKSVRDELVPAIAALPLYAQLGEANLAFRAGRYADVRKLTDPFVTQLKDGKLPNMKDTQLIQGMLGLSLRANVREGDTKRAREVLDLLQQSASGLQGGATEILVELVQQLRGQVEELRKKGKSAEAELDKTVSTFSAFLDELAKQPAQGQSPELIRFLAYSYAGLDKHDQAVALLEKIAKPAPSTNPDKEVQARENQEKDQFYHSVRLLLARELRLAGQFDRATQVLKEILASDLGKHSLDATKEKILILEDQKNYVAAAKEWNSLMNALRDKLNDPKMKEQYFECYYHFTRCYYLNGTRMKDETKKQNSIKRAASFIINLENKLPDMGGFKRSYDELLEKEAPLKLAYDEQKKASK